jgi:hypothetical protein
MDDDDDDDDGVDERNARAPRYLSLALSSSPNASRRVVTNRSIESALSQ